MEHQDSPNRHFPPKTTTDVSLLSYPLRLKSENTGDSCMCCVDTACEAPDTSHAGTSTLLLPASPFERQGGSKFPALGLDSSTALSVMLRNFFVLIVFN